MYLEESKISEVQQYQLDQFDFGLHLNRARKLGLYEVTDPEALAAATPKPVPRHETKKSKDSNKRLRLSTPKHNAPPINLPTTPETQEVEEEVEEDGKQN